MTLIDFEGYAPAVAEDAWVAPQATVIGQARVEPQAGVFYGAVIRADAEEVVLGRGSNLQDGAVIHADPGFPAFIGAGVSVGHSAVVHGCTLEDDCLIGMGAVVLNGARIGTGSLVAAGAVVTEGIEIPPRSLVAGVPAKVRREIDEDQLESIRENAQIYIALTRRHAQGAEEMPFLGGAKRTIQKGNSTEEGPK